MFKNKMNFGIKAFFKARKADVSETADIFVEELRLIFSDAGAVLLFIIAMVIYPLLYAIGYEKETIHDIPVAVVDLDRSVTSRLFSRMADATEQIRVAVKPGSLKEAEQLFYAGDVQGVLLIPSGFEKEVLSSRQTDISVFCDASYFLLYKQVFTAASYATATFNAGVEIKKMLTDGKGMMQALDQQDPLKVSTYNLYNPAGGYGSFVMPGMILIIMQQTLLIGIGMLGGTIREKKMFLKRTGKARHHSGSIRLVTGKALAYTFLYLFNAIFALGILPRWFEYPDHGHLTGILILFIPYILSVSFLGLAISMFFKERVHSMLFMVFLSPMVVFLSGISWPAQAIPPVLYAIAHLFPSTSMVPAYLKLRTMGAGLPAVGHEFFLMLAQMFLYFILAVASYRYAIRKFGRKIGKSAIM
jgi:ABC-2 type transport system permease protein